DERVAHGFGLSVQLGRQRQIAEVVLDENAQLLRAPHRSPRPASRSGALLRSPCSAPTARRGRRAPFRRRRPGRDVPAPRAPAPAARAAPPPSRPIPPRSLADPPCTRPR